MAVIVELVAAIIFVGAAWLAYRGFKFRVLYLEVLDKYRVYRLIKELKARNISLADVDEYVRVNLQERRPKWGNTLKEVDKEMKEELEEEKPKK